MTDLPAAAVEAAAKALYDEYSGIVDDAVIPWDSADERFKDAARTDATTVLRAALPHLTAAPASSWRVGSHYGIHVYEGDRPVATFHTVADAKQAVSDHNVRGLVSGQEPS